MTEVASLTLLGLIQGLTEFLPVSSTGHLVVARELLALSPEHALAVDAVLHLATALAVLVYFRTDVARLARSLAALARGREAARTDRTLIAALALGTAPAVALGLLFESQIEGVFRSPAFVAYALIAGSALFFVAERLAKQAEALTAKKGLAIGFFQALALIPGVSRSGATISGGLLLGLAREDATRLAFLLSFPVILGAGTLKFVELGSAGVLAASGGALFAAAAAAFFSGLAAIHFLLSFLKRHTLDVFIVYRVALAAFILLFLV
ncbi:MAG: undecaprenyl-diphosphate phosphatase [Candidatus Paceibacteria bacterium]